MAANDIIDDFLAKGWASDPGTRMSALAAADPGALADLVTRALDRIEASCTFVSDAISYLDEPVVADVIARALDVLAKNPGAEVAASIIERASLQVPHLLTPHLRTLWALEVNPGRYFEPWPWRCADDAEVARLVEIAQSPNRARRAWLAVLETRAPDHVARAADELERVVAHVPRRRWLSRVGFVEERGELARLHSAEVWHLRFPPGFLDDRERPAWLSRTAHATWSAPSLEPSISITFGGAARGACPRCQGELHQLLELPRLPASNPAAPGPLTLATCLSCLGWECEALYFSHDEAGLPTPLDLDGARVVPQFPSGPLRQTTATLVKLTARWGVQDWASSNSRENLHRVGGAPAWIQDDDYLECPRCTYTMRFIAQLDSDLPTHDGGEWLWGSGGLCYAFWCARCRVSGTAWQCT